MQKHLFHCQLKLKRMENASQRIKFNAELICIPRLNERVMFNEIRDYFLGENRKEGERLWDFFSALDVDDNLSVTCKVVQIIHFDHTMMEFNERKSGIVNEKAIGVLYLDELENEPICPTGGP